MQHPYLAAKDARKRRILVMDDEPLVLQALTSMLASLGCETSAVRDGAEAVRAYVRERDAGAPFDAVILDVNVRTGLGGVAAAIMLRALDPGLHVVGSSGYPDGFNAPKAEGVCFDRYLQKPYGVDRLSAALRVPERPQPPSPETC